MPTTAPTWLVRYEDDRGTARTKTFYSPTQRRQWVAQQVDAGNITVLAYSDPMPDVPFTDVSYETVGGDPDTLIRLSNQIRVF